MTSARTKVTAFVVGMMACLGPAQLASQGFPIPTASSGRLWMRTPVLMEGDRLRPGGILGDGSKDYRYSGLWIGLATGATVTVLGIMSCSDPDTGCEVSRPLTYGPLMTVVLGVTGAMIGAMFPKELPASSEP